MTTDLYCLYDKAVGRFGAPMPSASLRALVRSVLDNNFYLKHCYDFDVYLIGQFDDVDGHLVVMKPKLVSSLAKGVEKHEA